MWVVKLGGSLLHSPQLKDWLSVIATHADGQVIVVPGGGIFADAVREAQVLTGILDEIAHALALEAMAQFGNLLAGLNPAFVMVGSELEIATYAKQRQPMIWSPTSMVMADDTIPKSWQVTSDSLSVWLAQKIGATALVIVKAADAVLDVQTSSALDDSNAMNTSVLAEMNILDAAFYDFLNRENARKCFDVHIMHQTQFADFKNALILNSMDNTGYFVTR
jgi:5-(aminomethyl)-3-furanmethanol phosphate kinase